MKFLIKRTSGMQKGFKYNKSKAWYNNGEIETQIFDGDVIPDGFEKGRLKTTKTAWNKGINATQEVKDKLKQLNSNNKWYNNGKIEKCIKGGKEPPEGFVPGRLHKSEETRKKLSLANKGENNGNYGHYWTDEQKARAKQRNIENPRHWTDEQKAAQSKRLKGVNTWSKGSQRNPISTQRWKDTMLNKTPKDRLKWKEKEYQTKKANNSFHISKLEDAYYLELCNKYGENDVTRQYRDERYPFACDFYIKSEDKFIEFNKTWTHGGKPYDSNDEDCIALLNKWKEKALTSKYYQIAIYTWTDLDVRKREYADKNHLNYEVIY